MKSKFQSVRGVITRGKQILLMHRKKDGEEYVAVDAAAVKSAILRGKERYFEKQFSASEKVYYQTKKHDKCSKSC